ncbi:MAG: hypothetical protein ACLFVG_07670 [Candidatus Aminicenantes bacterium]
MNDFFEIKCLKREDQEGIEEEIKKRIADKKREGLLSEQEIRDIENMKLRPMPDIQDVQSVYKNHLFRKWGKEAQKKSL